SDTLEKWDHLKFAQEPAEEDYLAALSSGIASSEIKLRYIRTRLWWLGNDPVRAGRAERLPERHLENVAELVSLLDDEEPHQRFTKAEGLRELGRFEECPALLEYEFPEGYETPVNHI